MSNLERRKWLTDIYHKTALLIFSQEQKGNLTLSQRDQLLQLLEWVREDQYTNTELQKKWDDLFR